MSAKQIQAEKEIGQEIPLNSKLSAEFELYPFAFVSAEEFYLGERDGE